MPFDWNDFLTLAEELARRGDEASKRSAISRAYYAVYHRALARVVQRSGPCPQGQASHTWCWSKYQATNDLSCKELGNAGSRMKRRRQAADYNDNIPRLDDQVQDMLEDARKFPADLAGLNARFPSA
jgi:uncharacterized protein (UPF0332 family)